MVGVFIVKFGLLTCCQIKAEKIGGARNLRLLVGMDKIQITIVHADFFNRLDIAVSILNTRHIFPFQKVKG